MSREAINKRKQREQQKTKRGGGGGKQEVKVQAKREEGNVRGKDRKE